MATPKKITSLLLMGLLLIPAFAFGQAGEAASYVSRAKDEFEKKDLDAALADSEKAVDRDEKSADALRERGIVYEAMGKFNEASWDFHTAMLLNPDDVRNYYDGARMSYKAGDQTHALRYATRAIQLKPDFAGAYALRGSAKLREVRLHDAIYLKSQGGGMTWSGQVGFKEVPEVKVEHVDLDGALDDLTKAVTLEPGIAEVYDCRGLVKYFKGDKAGAIADFTSAITATPDYAPAWCNRGHAKLASGDAKGALADLDKAVALQPDFASAWGNRAAVKQYAGNFDGALADIGKAIELKPDYLEAYDFRGILRDVQGDKAGAAADFKKAGELEPQVFMSNWVIDYEDPEFVKQAKGDLDGTLAGLNEPGTMPVGEDKLKTEFALAYFARAKSNGFPTEDSKLADLDKAIALKPDFAEAYRERGLRRHGRSYQMHEDGFDTEDPMRDMACDPAMSSEDLYKQARNRNLPLALADLDKAETLGKAGDADTYKVKALIKKEDGDVTGAMADINKAMKLSPDSAEVYGIRASIENLLGDKKGARADVMHGFDLAVLQAKTPTDAAYAYYSRAMEKRERHDTAGALADFASTIAAFPGYYHAYDERARLNYARGKVEEAMKDLDESVAIDSYHADNSDAFYLRATIKRDKGDREGALADFSKARAMGSGDPGIWSEMALIEQGRNDYMPAYEDFTSALAQWFSMALRDARNGYKEQAADCLDKMQADMDKAATFKGTKLDFVLNRISVDYPGPVPRRSDEVPDKVPDGYAALIALRPGMGALYFIRGFERFDRHSLPEALADFRKTLALGNVPQASLDEAHFFIWVVRAQSGEEKEATEELKAWLAGRKAGSQNDPQDDWHAQIARFLTGSLAEVDFLKAAGNGDPKVETPTDQDFEAYFYTGIKQLLAGDKAGAVEYFEKSMQPRQDKNIEAQAAMVEWHLLKPDGR